MLHMVRVLDYPLYTLYKFRLEQRIKSIITDISFLSGGWTPFVPFKFYIKHVPSSSLIHVKGWEGGRLKFDIEIFDRSNLSLSRGGRIGAFDHSLSNVLWSNLSYRFEEGF